MPYEYGGYDLSRMLGMAPTRGTTIYSNLTAHVAGCGAPIYPHHPINCPDPSTWDWNGDNDLSCKHASVELTDEKLQAAINFSICQLLIDLARLL